MLWSDDLPVDGRKLHTFGELNAEREAERQGKHADDSAWIDAVFLFGVVIGAALGVLVAI